MTSSKKKFLLKDPTKSSADFLGSLINELQNSSEKTSINEVRVPVFLSKQFKSLINTISFDVESDNLADIYRLSGKIISIMTSELGERFDQQKTYMDKTIEKINQKSDLKIDESSFLKETLDAFSDYMPDLTMKIDFSPLNLMTEILSEWISETNMEEQFKDNGADIHVLASMIFALNFVALKFEDEYKAKQRTQESYHEQLAMLYAHMMSIDTIIRELRAKKPLMKELKEKKINVRQRMIDAAKASHAKTGKIKNDFEAWFLQNRQGIKYIKTKIGVAEKFFYEVLDSDDQERITPRTLEKHLTKILSSAPR